MKLNIDLNGHGDPHWLSGHGKVNRDAIRRKHRAAHYLTRDRVIIPAKPETRARLDQALANNRGAPMRDVTLPLPAEGHHEHGASAWSKHRVRTGQKKPLKIYGHHIARWARVIAQQDAKRIATAISVGLTSGDSNTDIAHRVIGSRRNNGTDGVTEVTRQHILRLGHGLLKKRKSRMGGHPLDV
jgi:hypothetical protein